MFDLIANTLELINEKTIEIEVNALVLQVFNHMQEENAIYIMAPEPKFLIRDISIAEISRALDINKDQIGNESPIQVIDGGLRTLLVPICGLKNCMGIHPDQEVLRQFCLEKEIDIVHVFTSQVKFEEHSFRTRVFAPRFGYLEDPATGSGNSAFGYYLLKNNMWSGNFSVEQGASLEFPNIVRIKKYETETESRILFGGCCTEKIAGTYYLYIQE